MKLFLEDLKKKTDALKELVGWTEEDKRRMQEEFEREQELADLTDEDKGWDAFEAQQEQEFLEKQDRDLNEWAEAHGATQDEDGSWSV